jgi:hypothetical protein
MCCAFYILLETTKYNERKDRLKQTDFMLQNSRSKFATKAFCFSVSFAEKREETSISEVDDYDMMTGVRFPGEKIISPLPTYPELLWGSLASHPVGSQLVCLYEYSEVESVWRYWPVFIPL